MGWGIMTNYASRSESFWIKETYQYLVDAGKSKKGKKKIEKHKSLFNGLNCFVISHGDEDHIGLANIIIEEIEPEIIVLSPLVYILEKFRYTFNPINLRLPHLFEGPYRIIELSEDDAFRVYAVKEPMGIMYPWNIPFKGTGLNEFQTYPTTSSNENTKLINDFISKVSSHTYSTQPWFKAIKTHKLIKNLRIGKLLNKKHYNLSKTDYSAMWNVIEKEILKKLRNEMSIVCRIGSTFFTGDATKKQLQEIEGMLVKQSELLNHEITIKINHHGSVNPEYEYFEFYKNMKPKQLLLKRDYQIQGNKTLPKPKFDKYVDNLKLIVTKNRFIDSKTAEDKKRDYQKFNTL